MSLLNLILAASRPYVPFTVTIGGESFNLFARKSSVADSEDLGRIWDESYSKARSSFDDTDEKKAPIFAQVVRLGKDALIKYILQADRNEIRSEAMQMHPNEDVDSEEVQHEITLITQAKEEDLKGLDVEDLRGMARDRRAHFFALSQGNEAVSRAMAVKMIYVLDGTEYKPLFESSEDAAKLSLADLSEMVSEASKALEVKTKIDPLESQPSSEEAPVAPSESSTP